MERRSNRLWGSLSFWAGLLVMLLLLGNWMDSQRRQMRTGNHRVKISQTNSEITFRFLVRRSLARQDWDFVRTEFMGFDVVKATDLPKLSITPGHGGGKLVEFKITHLVLMILATLTWIGLLAWRARRMRVVEENMMGGGG